MITIIDIIRKDKRMMAKVYYNRLLIGTITFDAIPVRYQDKAREYGRVDVEAGKMPVEQYEMLFKEPYEE